MADPPARPRGGGLKAGMATGTSDGQPEVFVYSPGRTATSSLGATLGRHGISHLITHNLDWTLWAETRRHGVAAHVREGQGRGIAYELQRMRQFEVALAGAVSGIRPPPKIIVGVRFPYDHLFSVIAFSAPSQIDSLLRAGLASRSESGIVVDADGYRAVIEEAAGIYRDSLARDPQLLDQPGTGPGYLPPVDGRCEIRNHALFYMKYMQTWLRREFQAVLGIDLLGQAPARQGGGSAVFESAYGQVLLYTIDHPALDLAATVGDFLGQGPLQLSHDNDASSRNAGFHALAMDVKARNCRQADLLAIYRADPLIRAIYADTGMV